MHVHAVIKMKLTGIFFLLLHLSITFSANSQNGILFDGCSHKANHDFLLTRAGALNNYDIKYHNIYWNINPNVFLISGRVTTHFVPKVNLNQIQFDMGDSLVVDSVKHGLTVLGYTHTSPDLLTITFPFTINSGTLDSVTVFYHGVPFSSGFGSFVKDTTGAGTPIIWTLSEPYGAKDWWPCKQNLADKIDSIDVFIEHPSQYDGVSNGIPVSKINVGSNTVSHWKHKYKIATYLICAAVTNYALYKHFSPYGIDTVEIFNYVYPEDSAAIATSTPQVVEQMQLFDTLFGIYPFYKEKYGHVQFNWGGGMEHQTSTFIGNFGYEVISHELAHQWFGDMVTCGSWSDIALNEGFATYLTGLCYEHLSPYWWPLFKRGMINNITSQPDGSVFCTDTTSVARIFNGRLSYYKGAMMYHGLRWVMGDSAFFTGVNAYLYDTNIYFGFSRMDQFITHMSNANGSDLTWFFSDWYYGEGFPSYQFSWTVDAFNNVSVTVNQTQSHSSVSFYEMPLPIYFKNTLYDTTIVLDHNVNGQSYLIPLSFKPDSLIFDPEMWILSNFNDVTGIGELENSISSCVVYPLVTTGDVFINSLEKSKMQITVCDLSGKLVYSEFLFSEKNKINLSFLSNGIYILAISGKEFCTKKIVRQ